MVYSTNWRLGITGWQGGSGWQVVNGILTFNGDSEASLVSPFHTSQLTNFAVQARIQSVANDDCCGAGAFGLLAHSNIVGGFYNDGLRVWEIGGNNFGSSNFSMDRKWHTYRLEVHGNSYRLLVDGVLAVTAMSNHSLSSADIGLYSYNYEINVKNYQVYSLGR